MALTVEDSPGVTDPDASAAATSYTSVTPSSSHTDLKNLRHDQLVSPLPIESSSKMTADSMDPEGFDDVRCCLGLSWFVLVCLVCIRIMFHLFSLFHMFVVFCLVV